MDWYRLQLLAPIAFVVCMFLNVPLQTAITFTGAFLIVFPVTPKFLRRTLLFAVLGLIRGSFIQTQEDIYSYKRTTFHARVMGIQIRQTGNYISIDQMKYHKVKTDLKVDEDPVLPKAAVVRIENVPDNLVIGCEIAAVGRFMVKMPNALAEQSDATNKPMGKLDYVRVLTIKDMTLKEKWRRKLDKELSPTSAMLAAAILIGDIARIDKTVRKEFQQAGISHLLGVSVLHVAIVGWLISLFFRYVLGFFVSNLATIIPLMVLGRISGLIGALFYCSIIGFEYPIQRSLLMGGLAVLSLYAGKRRNLESLLAASAIIIGVEPSALYNISFQLSFGAILGICAGAIAIPVRFKNTALNWIYKGVSSTLWASSIMVPISLYHFQTTSLQPFLANLVAIPFLSFIVTPISLVWMSLYFVGLEGSVAPALNLSFFAFSKIAHWLAPFGVLFHVEPFFFSSCLFLIFGVLFFAIFEGYLRWFFLLAGYCAFFITIRNDHLRKPFLLIHPYNIGLIEKDRIIAYPKCNFISEIWAAAYNLPCVSAKDTNIFFKEKCGKLVVENRIGLIFSELKHACSIKTKDYYIPFADLLLKTYKIEI